MQKKFWLKFLLSGLLLATLVLAGCAGDDGDTGPAGPPGAPGTPGVGLKANETCTVCHAVDRIADVADFHGLNATIGSIIFSNITPDYDDAGGIITPSVTFDFVATDANGNPVTVDLTTLATGSLTNLAYIRFSIAKLVPGTSVGAGEPDTWYDYANGQRLAAQLVNNGGNNYTYTFTSFDATNSALFDPTTTHRIAMQVSLTAFGLPASNPYVDYVPDGGLVTLTRDIVRIEACNECHDPLAFHGGGRIDTAYCVVCHNPTLAINVNGLAEGDMAYMVHKIHNSGTFLQLDDAISYAEVTYPQDLRNCDKCHTGADGDNWKTKPYIVACSSCHETFDATVHQGGVTNADCTTCHTVGAIELAHTTDNATANNPAVPAGAVNFTYVLNGVTVNASNAAVVDFTILADGVPLAGLATTYPPTGFTGGPSFLVAYAQPQDGIAAPADYNNLGKSAAQPASVTLASVASSLTAGATPGSYVATLSSAPFPAGATLRAIGLQGYFTQVTPAVARHTQSVVKAVTGDTVRRAVVSSAGCAECHEIFEGHGGNRVLTAAGGVEICILCHVANLSTSGRGADPALLAAQAAATAGTPRPAPYTGNFSQGEINAAIATIAAVGSNPLTYPEATNNFKDMIHGIHSSMSTVRTQDYEFVRDRGTSGVYYYNWSEVTYPGTINNCTKCHIGNSYLPESVPAGALVTTNVTTNGTVPMTRAVVQASRASVPNAADAVISKLAATCYSCHTSAAMTDHMKLNGAAFGNRSDVTGQ